MAQDEMGLWAIIGEGEPGIWRAYLHDGSEHAIATVVVRRAGIYARLVSRGAVHETDRLTDPEEVATFLGLAGKVSGVKWHRTMYHEAEETSQDEG